MINKNIKIVEDKIFLRSPIEKDVYGNWWKWFNDPEVTEHMNKGVLENTIENQLAFFTKMIQSEKDLILAICDRKTEMHIGTTGLHNIDWMKGSAQFGITIGEKLFWGKNIGSIAWKMIVNYGFEELNLKKIDTKIFSDNLASIRIAEKCGFKKIKLLKNDVEKNGKLYDRIYMVLNKKIGQ